MFPLDDPPYVRMSSLHADPIASGWLAGWEQIPSDGPGHRRSLDRECILDTVRAQGLGLCALQSCVGSWPHVPATSTILIPRTTAGCSRQIARQRFCVKPRSGSSAVGLPLLGRPWGAMLVNRMRPRQMFFVSGRGTKDPYVDRAGVRAVGVGDGAAGEAPFGSCRCEAGSGWAMADSCVTADELLARRLLAPALSRLFSIVFAPRKCR